MVSLANKYNECLAEYFSSKLLYLDPDENQTNIRKISEEPWQLMKSKQNYKLYNILIDCEYFFVINLHERLTIHIYWQKIENQYSPKSYMETWEKYIKLHTNIGYGYQMKLVKVGSFIGLLLEEKGFIEEAIEIQKGVLNILDDFGVSGTTKFHAICNLGRLILKQNKIEVAKKTLIESLEELKLLIGPNHIITLKMANELAKVYIEDSMIAKTRVLYRWIISVIGIEVKSLPLDRLPLIIDYSIFLSASQEYDEAKILLINVLDRLKVCNEKDPVFLKCKIALGNTLCKMKKQHQGFYHLEHAIAILQKHYGMNYYLLIDAIKILNKLKQESKL